MGTNIILKHTAFLVKQVLKNGFIIIKLLEMKVYCVPAKMNIFFRKKLSVVELYLSSEISYQDLALQEGITNPCMITSWVNRFRAAGSDALRPHKKDRKKTLGKSGKNPKIAPLEELSVDTSAEHVKELLSYTGMPKSTYMYWQKRFDRENPDWKIEEKTLQIRKEHNGCFR